MNFGEENVKTTSKPLRVPTMPASEDRLLDWAKAQKVTFPNLKASTETISLRMPAPLLHAIKREANRHDVPYQSLIKVVLAERFAAAKA
jgi:predicted DNA binding CopG/RHH family protein